MMDLSQQEQFDLDCLAEDLGALPEAPLSMPVQQLESPMVLGLLSILRFRPMPVQKASH